MNKQPDILLAAASRAEMNWPVNMTDEDRADFESEQTYVTNNTYLEHLRNVLISPDSVIYSKGSLLRSSLPSKEHVSYYTTRHFLKKIVFGKKKILDSNKKYLLVSNPAYGTNTFGILIPSGV